VYGSQDAGSFWHDEKSAQRKPVGQLVQIFIIGRNVKEGGGLNPLLLVCD
jgi:hypothetical protein